MTVRPPLFEKYDERVNILGPGSDAVGGDLYQLVADRAPGDVESTVAAGTMLWNAHDADIHCAAWIRLVVLFDLLGAYG